MGPVGTRVSFSRAGSTGGFQPDEGSGEHTVEDWVSPASLLEMPTPEDLVVWKSNIDGFDIHVLAHHWNAIDARCDAVWFEYDSPRTLGDTAGDERLIQALAESGRTLSYWLREQGEGHVVVPYLDVRALTERAKNVLQANYSRVVDWKIDCARRKTAVH